MAPRRRSPAPRRCARAPGCRAASASAPSSSSACRLTPPSRSRSALEARAGGPRRRAGERRPLLDLGDGEALRRRHAQSLADAARLLLPARARRLELRFDAGARFACSRHRGLRGAQRLPRRALGGLGGGEPVGRRLPLRLGRDEGIPSLPRLASIKGGSSASPASAASASPSRDCSAAIWRSAPPRRRPALALGTRQLGALLTQLAVALQADEHPRASAARACRRTASLAPAPPPVRGPRPPQ